MTRFWQLFAYPLSMQNRGLSPKPVLVEFVNKVALGEVSLLLLRFRLISIVPPMFTLIPSSITDTTIIQQLTASLNKTHKNNLPFLLCVSKKASSIKLRDSYCTVNRCKWWGTCRSEFIKPFVGSMCLSLFPLKSSPCQQPFCTYFPQALSRLRHPLFPNMLQTVYLHGHELWNKDGRESIEFFPDNHSLILRTYPRPLKRETKSTNCFLWFNMQSKSN